MLTNSLGTPTPRAPKRTFQKGVKTTGGVLVKESFADREKTSIQQDKKVSSLNAAEGKGKNCRELPKQNCQKLRVNPKPVWKNMTRKICRVPRTLSDKKLVQQVGITLVIL